MSLRCLSDNLLVSTEKPKIAPPRCIAAVRIDAVDDICTYLQPAQILKLQCAVFSESLYNFSQLTGGQ